MATVDVEKAFSHIGLETAMFTIEESPLEALPRFKAEGHIRNMAALSDAGKEQNVKKEAGKLLNDIIKRGSVPAALLVQKEKPPLAVKKILKNGDYMTVLWDDGTKTIVKRAADEAESDYAAFTAALGIKCFGSNSALKRIVASAEVQNKKKKKKRAEESEFHKLGRAFAEASKALALELQRLRDADDAYDQQKTDEWLDSVERGQNK